MDLFKWAQTKEGLRQIQDAKKRAWDDFKSRYPDADDSEFVDEPHLRGVNDVTAEVFFKEGPGSLSSVSGSDPEYWSNKKKEALGIGGFPPQLTLSDIKKPIPAEDNPEEFGSLLNKEMKIFITPSNYFTSKFRNIFSNVVISHESATESKKWLSGPDIRYWPQQLNFAFWCATTGCGISRETLTLVDEQLRSFLMFHIYFTTRRILWEMGGIQSVSALPGIRLSVRLIITTIKLHIRGYALSLKSVLTQISVSKRDRIMDSGKNTSMSLVWVRNLLELNILVSTSSVMKVGK